MTTTETLIAEGKISDIAKGEGILYTGDIPVNTPMRVETECSWLKCGWMDLAGAEWLIDLFMDVGFTVTDVSWENNKAILIGYTNEKSNTGAQAYVAENKLIPEELIPLIGPGAILLIAIAGLVVIYIISGGWSKFIATLTATGEMIVDMIPIMTMMVMMMIMSQVMNMFGGMDSKKQKSVPQSQQPIIIMQAPYPQYAPQYQLAPPKEEKK